METNRANSTAPGSYTLQENNSLAATGSFEKSINSTVHAQ